MIRNINALRKIRYPERNLVIGGGFRGHTCYVQTSTIAYSTIPCPVEMRAAPTFGSPTNDITVGSLGDIRDVGNVSRSYNSTLYTILAGKLSSNHLSIQFIVATASSFVNLGRPAVMRVASGVLLSFDAEL